MLTIKHAADRLGISPSKMYQLVTRRRVPHYRIGGKILFDESDVEGYKQKCRVGAAGDHDGDAAPPAAAPTTRLKHLTLRHGAPARAGTSDFGRGAGTSSPASRDRSDPPGLQR